MTTFDDVAPWLGDAADDISAIGGSARNYFLSVWDALEDLYPDTDDQQLRDEALSAVVQCLLAETRPTDAGDRLRRARTEVALAMAAAQQVAVFDVTYGGRAEATVAREAGVDRMTMRKWLGKR